MNKIKSILITGGTGFLGRIITNELLKFGHTVESLGISSRNNIICDLTNSVPEFEKNYDWVIHCAGKAHSVPETNKEKDYFLNLNYEGTKRLLHGLERKNGSLLEAFIYISSVSVYGIDSGLNINENHPLYGSSPYALSKIKAEKLLNDWFNDKKTNLGILRPSLIAGKNPPGNLGDMINGISSGKYLRIGNGTAQKSIIMGEDVANVIPQLAEVGGTFNLCDDRHPSFAELEMLIINQIKKKKPYRIPYLLAKAIAIGGDVFGQSVPLNSEKLKKITSTLTFSNTKAKNILKLKPLDVLENFIIR